MPITWQVADFVRVRGVRGLEGRPGQVHTILGANLVSIQLLAVDPTINRMAGQKRVKVKPKHLERTDRLAVMMDLKVPFWTCNILRAAPASYGGESTEDAPTDTLSWLPRRSSLIELEIESEDRHVRQIASRLSQGDFVFSSSNVIGDGIEVFVDRAPVLRFALSLERSQFCLHYDPSFGKEIYPDGDRLGMRVLHHIIRQHGKLFPARILRIFGAFLGKGTENIGYDILVSADNLLDAFVALQDSGIDIKSSPSPSAYDFDYLCQLGVVARLANNHHLAAKTFDYVAAAAAEPRMYRLSGHTHFHFEDFVRAESAYLLLPGSPDAAFKFNALRVCYQNMGTREAAALNLVISSLFVVAGDGYDVEKQNVDFANGCQLFLISQPLQLHPRFNSRHMAFHALRRKYRKESKADDLLNRIAGVTEVAEFRSQVLNCLNPELQSAASSADDDATGDPFEHLDEALRKVHDAWTRRNTCKSCGRLAAEDRFPICACGLATYCSKACQRAGWEAHRDECTYVS